MDIIASYSSDDSDTVSEQGEKSKTVDFFNLDSSDTDDFEKSDNMQSLLDSAYILNERSCGPSFQPQSDNLKENYISSETFATNHHFLNSDCLSLGRDKTKSSSNYDSKKELNESTSNSNSRKKIKIDVTLVDNYPTEDVLYRLDTKINQVNTDNIICHIPRSVSYEYKAHLNPVTALNWCVSSYSHLFLSASTDCTLKVWDISNKFPSRTIQFSSGLKAAKWTCDGKKVICGGFGKISYLSDISTGKHITEYHIDNYVTSVENHAKFCDVFLVGTKNKILAFDARIGEHMPVNSYLSKCGDILDIVFINEQEFVCSTSIVSHDSADRTIMAWDFSSGAILSNQIFLERYTCPSLKVEPSGSEFVAQTNGDYVTAFSTKRPYKRKNKRFMGHKVSGYGIKCDISPDGKYLVSGDANGDVYIYNYRHTNLVKTLSVSPGIPVNCVQWHPVLPKTIITSNWDGNIQLWS